ncbi:MAG TPA: hypothetical protein VK145_03245 [Candidatus Nanoarchaeia archaeon]|nr:hypothetical protein [Candidatus Nanoarchaeia archaeon]
MGSELIFEGKKYISASRAGSITGYNSDYIGQLCRKNLLDCRRVGRSWFVSEESLLAHKVTASMTPRGRIPIYQKSDAQVGGSSVAVGAATFPQPFAGSFGVHPELSYRSFHQAAINFLDRREQERLSGQFARRVVGGLLVVVVLMVFVVPNVIGTTGVIGSFSRGNVGGADIAIVGNKVSESIAFAKNYRAELVGTVAYSSHVFTTVGTYLDGVVNNVIEGTYRRLTKINSFIAVTSEKLGQPFGSSNDDQKADRAGFVVVPSGGDDVNRQVKEYVENNFSDEAQIIPDASGNSGLIKPVFKNQSDQEYLYVMVPVKEEGVDP